VKPDAGRSLARRWGHSGLDLRRVWRLVSRGRDDGARRWTRDWIAAEGVHRRADDARSTRRLAEGSRDAVERARPGFFFLRQIAAFRRYTGGCRRREQLPGGIDRSARAAGLEAGSFLLIRR
jgi:hypothetical protein